MFKTFSSLQSWMLSWLQTATEAAIRLAAENNDLVATATKMAEESAEAACEYYHNPEAYDSFFRDRYAGIYQNLQQDLDNEAWEVWCELRDRWEYYNNPTDCQFSGQKMSRHEKHIHRRMCAMFNHVVSMLPA